MNFWAQLGTLPEMAEGGTDLARALECVAADLARSPFQVRFPFVPSDGEPHEESAVRIQITRLTEDEVALVGLGLGPKTEKLAEFFPVSRAMGSNRNSQSSGSVSCVAPLERAQDAELHCFSCGAVYTWLVTIKRDGNIAGGSACAVGLGFTGVRLLRPAPV